MTTTPSLPQAVLTERLSFMALHAENAVARETLEAAVAALSKPVGAAVLTAHAEGRMHHLNRGLCPDQIAGHNSRDDDCPVCNALDALSRMGGESVPAWQPIETAPKVGVILLSLPAEGALKYEGRRVYEGRWNEDQRTFTSVNGFLVLGAAVAWRPLPEPATPPLAAPTAPAQQAAPVKPEAPDFEFWWADKCPGLNQSEARHVWSILFAGVQQAADVQGERRPVTAFEDATLRKAAMRSATVVSAGAAAQSVPKADVWPQGFINDVADASGIVAAHGHSLLAASLLRIAAGMSKAASAPTVGGADLRHQIENAIASTGHTTSTPVDATELADTIANALAAQEPSAAAEPVGDAVAALREELAQRSIYRGNSIAHIYDKAECYGGIVTEIHSILRPRFANGDREIDVRELARRAAAAPPTPPSAPAETFDAAVSEELLRVSHVEYDSHEICKNFATQLRARLFTSEQA